MKGFYRTVAIVTMFSIAEKFLGFLYRVYLSRTIGSEGIGLYQVALSVFALLLTITCSGTPITVSRLMTKYRAEGKEDKVKKVITAGLTFTLALALPIALVFMLFGSSFSFLFADERCLSVFLIVIPGLIFTSIYSVLRGVFWGNKDFLPYSVTELLEEICMIIAGIFLIERATSVENGVARAGLAVLISYLFSFSLATAVFILRKNKLKNPLSEFKPLLLSAIPVTAMRTANSFTSSLVSIILPLRLIEAGFEQAGAMSAFGAAVGQAFPLLYVPTTLIGSFILVLVPEISENFYKKQNFYLKRNVEKALKFTAILSAVFVPIFFVCGEEIGILVFDGHECGEYLTAASFLMLFMSLSSITTSILNSMGLEHKTLIYYLLSGIFMLIAIYSLPRYIGIYSLIVGYAFIYGITTVLNLVLLQRNCEQKPKYLKHLLGITLLIIPTSFFGIMLERILLPILGTLVTFLLSSIIMACFYFVLAFIFGLINIKIFKSKFKSRHHAVNTTV